MAERKILEAGEPFSVTLRDGTPFSVARGDRFYSDDQIVKGRERLFGELQVRTSGPARPSAAAETATAAPGERRVVSVPKDPQATELDDLRQQAETAGVRIDKRWGADKLRQEIEAADKARSGR